MLYATPIARSLAHHLAKPTDPVAVEIHEFCMSNYGKPLRVCLGGIGDIYSREPDIRPTPFVEIYPMGNVTSGNETGEDTAYVGMRVVVDARDRENFGAPEVDEDGVHILNFEPGLETLVGLIQRLASMPIHKALSRSWQNGEDGTGFPVCETEMLGTYYGKANQSSAFRIA